MFTKLRNRFLILNMAVTSLVMLMAFGAVYFSAYNNIQAENARKLNDISYAPVMVVISNTEAPQNAPEINRATVSRVSPGYSLSFIIVVDKDGSVADIDSFIDMPDDVYYQAAETAWQNMDKSKISLSGRQWMYAVEPMTYHMISADGQISVGFEGSYQIKFLDITDAQKTLRSLLTAFLFVGTATFAVIFFVSLYFANRSIKPVAGAWEKQRLFVADASHELKTPLSVITANYDALLSNQEETISSQMEWLDYMKIGTDRMAKLINDLLTLAKMEDINVEVSKTPFCISDKVNDIISSMETAAHNKDLIVVRSIEPGVTVNSDKKMVAQVFTILYENAIKYSDENGEIDIALKTSKRRVICSVKNSGKGIAGQDLPKIFDRFYRADQSRTGDNGGYGLGLSIAKTIMGRLGGDIAVNSEENKFTAFTFTLPDVL